ncbi:MAG: 50S ribosomal protein L24e [archaeon]
MAKCSYCKTDIKPGTGFLYVKKDGKTLWFCARKCEKNNLKLKRKPQNVKWLTKKKKVVKK